MPSSFNFCQPPNLNSKKTDLKKANRASTVWCSLSKATRGQDALCNEVTRISTLATKTMRVASIVSLLDVLEHLEKGLTPPTPDQGYFQVLLSAMNKTPIKSHGRSEVNTTLRTRLHALLATLPAYTEPTETFSWNGISLVANPVARTLGTAAMSSVTTRFWRIQREKLREKVTRQLHVRKQLKAMPASSLDDTLTKIQLLVRDPRNYRDQGDYGFEAPFDWLNAIITREFNDLPRALLPQQKITRRLLKANWPSFFPYLRQRLREIEANQIVLRVLREYGEKPPNKPKLPYIGVTKAYTLLPVFSFTPKTVLFEPSGFKQVLNKLGLPAQDGDEGEHLFFVCLCVCVFVC